VLIVDSVQTIRLPDAPGAAGSVTQVRDSAAAVVACAKERGMATVIVGHVTKDGQLAGPRVLEHLVDAVCEIEGDRHHALRLLRATKNRFGAVGEVGCFEMTEQGLAGVDDPGRLFVGDTPAGTSGVAVTIALEGQRPMACEVQALVNASTLTNPRRVASGLDGQRMNLLVAVLEQRAEVKLAGHDIYASSVGGVRLSEPAVDLALSVALASSFDDSAVLPGVVALGEVGLAGELRLVAQMQRRLSEASRLGFAGAVVPAAYDGPAYGLRLLRARDLVGALAVGLDGGRRASA
jgi:DNA repair protein RadA/Sms